MIFLDRIKYFLNKPKRYRQLFRALQDRAPLQIMEIGTWRAARAKAMIELAKKFHSPREIHYYGFDLFEDLDEKKFNEEVSKIPPSREAIRSRLLATEVNIHLYQGDTVDTLPKVVSDLPMMDFVFIDGGHSLKTIQSDWDNVEKLMNESTCVIFDDYWSNRVDAGAKPVVDKIDRKKFKVEVLPIIDRFVNNQFGELVIQLAKVTKKSI